MRSPHAHAKIVSIDTSDESMPGVLGIFSVEDLKAEGIGNIPAWLPQAIKMEARA